MVFNSLEECISYVESCMDKSAKDVGNKVKEKGREVIGSQVSGITGNLQNAVRVNSASRSNIEVEIYDKPMVGADTYAWSWVSVGYPENDPRYGQHFFPMYGLEHGFTWNRGQTTIMPTWKSESKDVAKNAYLRAMRGMGVPIG